MAACRGAGGACDDLRSYAIECEPEAYGRSETGCSSSDVEDAGDGVTVGVEGDGVGEVCSPAWQGATGRVVSPGIRRRSHRLAIGIEGAETAAAPAGDEVMGIVAGIFGATELIGEVEEGAEKGGAIVTQ